THPKVTVMAGAKATEFTGSVMTPGALVLLPEKASALVEGAWQSIPELAVAIAGDHRSLHPLLPLPDLRTPLRTPPSNCLKATHTSGSNSGLDLRYWHKADILHRIRNVRFRG